MNQIQTTQIKCQKCGISFEQSKFLAEKIGYNFKWYKANKELEAKIGFELNLCSGCGKEEKHIKLEVKA